MNHVTEEDLILLYYNEPGVPEDARSHLADCPQCRAAAQSLAQTLNLADEWQPPEPSRDMWLQLRREAPPRQERFRLFFALAAAAAVLAVAFIAGRVTQSRAPAVPLTGLSTTARDRILAISLADHLDRAQVLLTEISNQTSPNAAELDTERGRAQDLVDEGRLLRQALERSGPAPTVAALDEVERFLVEVAHSPDNIPRAEIVARQERLASASLLFKVRIIESNLRTEGQGL